MKKNIRNFFVHAVLISFFLTAFSFTPKAQVSVSFQVFYDQLSPYGSWINYPDYGYVWIPTQVPQGFRPYATGAIGYIQMMAGHGFLIIIGAGLRFIMAIGFTINIMAGCGCLITNGRLPG